MKETFVLDDLICYNIGDFDRNLNFYGENMIIKRVFFSVLRWAQSYSSDTDIKAEKITKYCRFQRTFRRPYSAGITVYPPHLRQKPDVIPSYRWLTVKYFLACANKTSSLFLPKNWFTRSVLISLGCRLHLETIKKVL